MTKYYGHTLLYLHETIAVGSGRSDRFTEVFVDTYQPMMAELGVRLFAIWECTVWTTQCSNYFRAANGRVVTQWPRSAGSFWGMTRRFKSADFDFEAR